MEELLKQIAPILTALGGLIAALVTAIIAVKQTKGHDSETSNRAAVAVTNFERTSVRVDSLWETIKDLIEEVAKLKEDKAMQQEQIDQLTKELADEKRRHSETQDKLNKLIIEHNKTLELLAEKEALIAKYMKEETHGKSTK